MGGLLHLFFLLRCVSLFLLSCLCACVVLLRLARVPNPPWVPLAARAPGLSSVGRLPLSGCGPLVWLGFARAIAFSLSLAVGLLVSSTCFVPGRLPQISRLRHWHSAQPHK